MGSMGDRPASTLNITRSNQPHFTAASSDSPTASYSSVLQRLASRSIHRRHGSVLRRSPAQCAAAARQRSAASAITVTMKGDCSQFRPSSPRPLARTLQELRPRWILRRILLTGLCGCACGLGSGWSPRQRMRQAVALTLYAGTSRWPLPTHCTLRAPQHVHHAGPPHAALRLKRQRVQSRTPLPVTLGTDACVFGILLDAPNTRHADA
jgi:hypothetical protein